MQTQAELYEAFSATGREVRDPDDKVIAWGSDDFITEVIARLLNEVEQDATILLQRRSISE